MSLIYAGYSTLVNLDNINLLCNSYSINENASIIESNSGYGGILEGDINKLAIGNPYIYDFGEINGNISFNPEIQHLDLLKNWICIERNQSKSLQIKTGSSSYIRYNECYINSLTINANESQLVEADIGFTIVSDVINNGNQVGGFPDKQSGFDVSDYNVIPYWKTHLTAFSDVISWNLNINQPVTPKYFCSGLNFNIDKAQEPEYILIGQLDIEISVTILTTNVGENFSNYYKNYEDECKINIDTMVFDLKKLSIINLTPQIADAGGYISMELMYKAFKIS